MTKGERSDWRKIVLGEGKRIKNFNVGPWDRGEAEGRRIRALSIRWGKKFKKGFPARGGGWLPCEEGGEGGPGCPGKTPAHFAGEFRGKDGKKIMRAKEYPEW